MLCTVTANSLQHRSASLQTMEFLLLTKDYQIDFHGNFHDNLNSDFAICIVNQNLKKRQIKNCDEKTARIFQIHHNCISVSVK